MGTTALILAGHGSHISPHTAGLVWNYVDSLRQWNIADEITACFWKEPPSFHHVLDTVASQHVTVVPVFTAQGYFANTVLPTEMALNGEITEHGGKTVYYTPALGAHPDLTQIVHQRVNSALTEHRLNAHEVAVAVIGHGTERNPQSREATQRQAHYLREAGVYGEVVAVYLDDSPSIPEIYGITQQPTVIAVPFFLAPGSHVTRDVPDALGLPTGATSATIQGRTVHYTQPVGTDETVCDMIVQLARGTGQPFDRSSASPWSGFPASGRDELLRVVREAGSMQFGQLLLTPIEAKSIENVDNDGSPQSLDSPAALRRYVRESPFRPLPTSGDLPGGWTVTIGSPEMLHAVVETIYPGAVADWAANRHGALTISSVRETGQRQTGMFRALADMGQESIEQVTHSICSRCVRHPTWFHGETPDNAIPCREVCNLWMSAAKDSLRR